MGILHYIAHLTSWYQGQVVSKIDTDGNIWIAFQCSTCGKISGKHISCRNKKALEPEGTKA